MQCPACNVTLMMTDRQGIEIDYCPQCRGVWLDRGELDKIIERSAGAAVAPQPNSRPSPSGDFRRDPHYGHDHHHGKHHKKKSLLGEIFDF
jgi:Zn-finger nucleic acid-binding protein